MHKLTVRTKNWTCPICHSKFIWRKAFKAHIKQQHKDTGKSELPNYQQRLEIDSIPHVEGESENETNEDIG